MNKESNDMRYGINSLASLMRNKLGFSPMNGNIFIFPEKWSNQIQLLRWDWVRFWDVHQEAGERYF
jgi:transposase